MTRATRAARVRVERDGGETVAVGAQFPSGTVVVEWRREAFPEGERTEEATRSEYGSVEDAEQATGGTVEFEEGA